MSSSSSSSEDGSGNGGGGAGTSSAAAPSSSRRGGRRRRAGHHHHEFGAPSSSRLRAVNEVWPEPFLEALAIQVAIDASRSRGRLSVAAALANLFQVCTTWRAVSRSDLLWHRLTRRIWGRTHLLHGDTWRSEFMYWHGAASNFRTRRRCVHTVLQYDHTDDGGGGPPPDGGASSDPDALACRCLTLSDSHLACGFADGAVRLFDLTTLRHVRTLRPIPGDVLGRFSRAVAGIVLAPDGRVVFATLDGGVHAASLVDPPRRAQAGNLVDDGVLVDFSGNGRWWVGLYAGVPGRAFHVWNGVTEELLFVGGTLTDPESVTGWQMLIELTLIVGRVRVMGHDTAVACTGGRSIVFDLRNPIFPVAQEEHEDGLVVTTLAVANTAYVIVDSGGWANVRRAATMEWIARFGVRRGAWQRGLTGCMNRGNVLMCAGGLVRAWEVESGLYLYRLREEIGDVSALVADERHVVASSSDGTLHLWDFGPH